MCSIFHALNRTITVIKISNWDSKLDSCYGTEFIEYNEIFQTCNSFKTLYIIDFILSSVIYPSVHLTSISNLTAVNILGYMLCNSYTSLKFIIYLIDIKIEVYRIYSSFIATFIFFILWHMRKIRLKGTLMLLHVIKHNEFKCAFLICNEACFL